MVLQLELFGPILFLPFVFSASFPLTVISHYSELAPCAASHLSVDFNTYFYDGCSSANTPISAYGSCLCAQRLSSIQQSISIDFEFDPECSSTAVQPFVTAFCDKWGVDIGAVERSHPSTTTTLGRTGPTGAATPGNVGIAGQPTPTSASSSGSASGSGLSGDKITIIATVVGSVAGIIAVFIAWKTLHKPDSIKKQGSLSLRFSHSSTYSDEGHCLSDIGVSGEGNGAETARQQAIEQRDSMVGSEEVKYRAGQADSRLLEIG
ncbi:MAG: hypothetical protein Q9214_000919 [Letrouitia sp. 1 TL-2023]